MSDMDVLKAETFREIETLNYNESISSYYLRIKVKDISGVLAKITSNLNEQDVSIETILQIPENNKFNSNNEVPIIITTHETTLSLINKAIKNIENLDFVVSKIVIFSINKT